MVEMVATYEGQLGCSIAHGPSGNRINTDAPKDNQGRGLAFSPTDLVGAALASCLLTIMGIYAQRHNLDLVGTTARVTKEMVTAPVRRIGRLRVTITIPKPIPAENRQALENAARACPVAQSLHPDVEKIVEFVYQA